MNWNPDDIVLTIEAHQEISNNPTREDQIIASLAKELGREATAVAAAVAAVTTPDMQATAAAALISCLLGDEGETRRLSGVIRKLRHERCP